MLNAVYIDGLRSLKDIKLDLNPGLNVLVGPNGSGKSNILIAFELISYLNRLEYLNDLGAVGPIKFSDLFDALRAKKSIKIKLDGESKIESKDFSTLRYEYECKIEYATEFGDRVQFSFQSLKLHSIKQGEIFSMVFNKGTVCRTMVHPKLSKSFEIGNLEESADEDKVNQLTKFHYQSNVELLRYNSLIREVGLMFNPFEVVADELNSMKLFNIDPNRIRIDDKKKATPEIGKDGTGLASVLHEIWEHREIDKPVSKSKYFPRTNFSSLYRDIISTLNLVSNEFIDFEIDFDELTKEIECEVVLNGKGNQTVTQPLKQMSDGTLKWLSLNVALLTTRNMFILENPESFLNASMQQMFTEFARDSIEYVDNFGLISTHSETILDTLKPEEIIVTFFREGYTHTTRIEDIDLLNKVMTRSGNGLGWYFLMSSLEPDENGRVLPIGDK